MNSTDLVLLTFLFLHIGGAIVAFGPTFAFPIIGAMGGKEPQHVNFAIRLTYRLSERMVLPVAIWVGLTGIALIWRSGHSVTEVWLGLGILFYVIALSISLFVMLPNARALIAATSGPPPTPAPGSALPSGPPAHLVALIKRQQMAGMVVSLLIVLIVIMMVFKPGAPT